MYLPFFFFQPDRENEAQDTQNPTEPREVPYWSISTIFKETRNQTSNDNENQAAYGRPLTSNKQKRAASNQGSNSGKPAGLMQPGEEKVFGSPTNEKYPGYSSSNIRPYSAVNYKAYLFSWLI